MNHAGRGGIPDGALMPLPLPFFCAYVFETRVPGLF
jgi:hypothetical protein